MIRYVLLLCFFITGVTGLVYELVWVRMLILAFGSTQFAITTVLTTFMAGLALGALLFGRLIDRHPDPIKIYGIIELGIGIYCFLTPFLFATIRSLYFSISNSGDIQYASFSLIQFLLSFIGIIIPTTLMGGSLPILVKYFTERKEDIGLDSGVLYSINTLGATLGCFATGFFLLYSLGVKATLFTAGGIDIVVGILAIYISVHSPRPIVHSPSPFPSPHRGEGWVRGDTVHGLRITDFIILISFALSGFAALAYEVLWTRILSLILGSSIYAFTIMLSTFLLGLGIGSVLFAHFINRRKTPLIWFGILELIIGLSVLLSIPFYRKLPFIFLDMYSSFSNNYWVFLLFQFLLCSSIMIIPTICMGATFPTVSKIYTKNLDILGKSIGHIYFFNTVGAIFGSFIGGFVFIPVIGIQRTVILMTILNILLGATILAFSPMKLPIRAGVAGISIAIIIASPLMLPPWEKMVMTIGPYANPVTGFRMEAIKKGKYDEVLLFYKEGINAVITVRKSGIDGNTITYQANGKNEARAVGSKPSEAWSILGHIPMLLAKDAKSALLVGLGSGITLGAMEQYPLDKIDVVEIEPAVVEAARFFNNANNNALEDKRVRLHITDGRNFLFSAKEEYDVIISAVSDPWITGVSNLFTREYFNEINHKLAADGIVALWFQNYRISPYDLKTGLNTFASVFPYVSLWFHYTGTADLIVIGSRYDHRFDPDLLHKRMPDEKIKKDLSRIEILTPFDIFSLYLMGNNDLREYIKGSGINTDDKPILEFTIPRFLYSDPDAGSKERVLDMIGRTKEVIPPVIVLEADKEEFYYRLGVTYSSYVFRTEQAISLFRKVLEINPRNKASSDYIETLKKEQASGDIN